MRWLRWFNVVLSVFVALALAYVIAVIPTGTTLIPGTTVGDHREANLSALRRAVTEEVSHMLVQDYRTARQTMQELIDGATGTQAEKYRSGLEDAVNGAAQLKTTSTGEIRTVAITTFDGTHAKVLVTASQELRNVNTTKRKATTTCAAGTICLDYRLLLTYERVEGDWKMSNLGYLNLP